MVIVLVIGLTGGIASGKSTAARQLAELGATVVDADILGHEIYQPGRTAWQQLVAAFGRGILGPGQEIDRRRLGSLVFGDPEAMKRLTGIVWPLMKVEMTGRLRRLADEGTRFLVLEAAVLLEAGWDDLADEVWTVTVSPNIAAARLIERTGASLAEAERRIATQMSNAERSARADVVIDNDGTAAEFGEKIEACWRRLMLRSCPSGSAK